MLIFSRTPCNSDCSYYAPNLQFKGISNHLPSFHMRRLSPRRQRWFWPESSSNLHGMRAEEFDLVLAFATRSFTNELNSWTMEFMFLILVVWLSVRSFKDCNLERILFRYSGLLDRLAASLIMVFGLFGNSSRSLLLKSTLPPTGF